MAITKPLGKDNRAVRFTTRFTDKEAALISKYAKLQRHETIVAYIRQCIADNIRLAKEMPILY